MSRLRALRSPAAGLWLLAVLAFLTPHVQADPAQIVRVEMREFAFRPSTIRLGAGRPVRLVFTNRGQIAHQFEAAALRSVPAVVSHGGLRVETTGLDIVRLQPGGTATLDLYIRSRGRFRFACTIEGHAEAGMVGILELR